MKPGFRFHPKALLLSGPKAATLLVGSGNLTFGGWRENGEIWSQFETDRDGTSTFAAFHGYMREIVELCPQPRETVTSEVEEAFDPNSRAWATDMDSPGGLLGRAGLGGSMLDQVKVVWGEEKAQQLYVCVPYFDAKAEALQALAQELGGPPTTVLVQGKHTNLLEMAVANLSSDFSVKATTYKHKEKAGSDGVEQSREAMLHAKFYAARRGDTVAVFAGSANCSRAALTIPGSLGNAELMTFATYSIAEFERSFIDELAIDDMPPELLKDPPEEPMMHVQVGAIHIRAARMEGEQIRVAYQADSSTNIKGGLGDGVILEVLDQGDGFLSFLTRQQPRMIILIGTKDGADVQSLPHWIDNEYALGATARGRSLAESIHSRVRGATWGIGAWSEVLSVLYKHLQFMPKAGAYRHSFERNKTQSSGDPAEFEWGDVFSGTYGLNIRSNIMASFPTGLEGKIESMRSMLLRWFGIVQPESTEELDKEDESSPAEGVVPDQDVGEGVDRQTVLPKAFSRSRVEVVSEKDRKRALKLVGEVSARLGESEYLSERRPELLAADLKVASVLLRVGLADEWLTQGEFFDATLAIWLPLFFNAAGDESTGWLDQRHLTSADPKGFSNSISSPELAAALGCWALSTPAKATGPQHVRFELASAMGVARLPWLWQTGGNANISREIAEIFSLTSRNENVDRREIERRWRILIRRGYAIDRLGKAIASLDVKQLRARLKQTKVDSGELLWQEGYGFCVAKGSCIRDDKQKGEVLVLQQGDATKIFRGSFLMPVSGLLEDCVLGGDVMPAKARKELLAMVEELRMGLAKQ